MRFCGGEGQTAEMKGAEGGGERDRSARVLLARLVRHLALVWGKAAEQTPTDASNEGSGTSAMERERNTAAALARRCVEVLDARVLDALADSQSHRSINVRFSQSLGIRYTVVLLFGFAQ